VRKERIDFSGVPKEIRRGGGARHIPEGDYALKILKVEKRWKDNDKSNKPYFSWIMQVSDGPAKGTNLYYVTSLKTDALFNLRNLIHAVTGKNVAGRAVNWDPESVIGKKVAGTVQDDEYEGKIRSRLVDVYPIAELEEENGDDEEEVEEEEVEEEEGEEEEDLEDVDVEDL
jgi:hypothetical protein